MKIKNVTFSGNDYCREFDNLLGSGFDNLIMPKDLWEYGNLNGQKRIVVEQIN